MHGTDQNDEGQDYSDILISKRDTQEYLRQTGLKKNLTSSHLWGISVGAVISGQFIGWNNGLNFVSPLGLLCLTAIVAVFYVLIINIMIKLSIAHPFAGGSYAYARKAYGKMAGFLAGYMTFVEYLCITSVIFVYMEIYIESMLVIIWPNLVSVLIFGVLILLQVTGINKSSFFQLLVTCLCVSIFLLFFMGINSVENAKLPIDLLANNDLSGLFLAVPYVLWFFVGIDAVMLTAEEIKNPDKSVPASFYGGLFTIIALSFGVIFFAVSSVYWPSLRSTDYPLIFILQKLQGGDAVLLAVFSFFSISSFIASINGMMIGYSRQAFSLARAGYFPRFMDKIHYRTKAPFMALIAPSLLVMIIAQIGDTDLLIQIVCICAIISYAFSLASYIKISGIDGTRLFSRIPAYIGLISCLVFLLGFCVFQTISALISAGILAFGILYYLVFSRGRINSDAPEEVEATLGDITIIMTNI